MKSILNIYFIKFKNYQYQYTKLASATSPEFHRVAVFVVYTFYTTKFFSNRCMHKNIRFRSPYGQISLSSQGDAEFNS